MSRRSRRRERLAVSLFPFLSVLACVIGTLTLLLAAIAIQRLGGPSLDRVRLAAQMKQLQAALSGGEARLVELEAQLRASEAQQEEQAELGRRLTALGLSEEIPLEELEKLSEIATRSADLEARRRALEEKRKSLASRRAAREAELDERRARQASAPIVIDPTGLGRDWRPYLIECTADYIELYRTSGGLSFRIPSSEISTSEDFRRYLRRARAIHDSIVIFLIRPDGVSTFQAARQEADEHGVRNAKLPLPGVGELDFSRMSGES